MTQQMERQLIRRALDGDQRAYASLFHAHRSRVTATVAQRTGDADDVEDLVQIAFIRAFGALSRFRGDAAFSTWLTRIALNVCHTYHAGRQTRLPLEILESASAEGARAPGPAPDDRLVRKQTADRLAAEIRLLPDRYRRALWLHYIEDLSYPEVVDRLDAPPGTVKTWLHRGRRLVRASLESEPM